MASNSFIILNSYFTDISDAYMCAWHAYIDSLFFLNLSLYISIVLQNHLILPLPYKHALINQSHVAKQGYILTSEIDGTIQMKSYLTGNPEIRLALNDDLSIGRGGKSVCVSFWFLSHFYLACSTFTFCILVFMFLVFWSWGFEIM